ncbi:MAG: hypothetical protein WBO06_04450 [Gammaproteobacteria bacterium]
MSRLLQRGMTALLGLFCAVLVISASALEDPTRPAGYGEATKAGVQGWTLNSTLVGPDRRIAVINGQYVSEGEMVGSARVLHIRNLDVEIESAGERITLQLLPGAVNK